MRLRLSLFSIVLIAACGAGADDANSDLVDIAAPPPIPEGVETVDFNPETSPLPTTAEADTNTSTASTRETKYWGVKDGEALTIMWEDLMPEGSEEALIREYEEFYAMLEKRYAANTTTLFDADPYAAIEEGSEFDFMPQLGTFDTVEDLNGEHVRIPGYVVPFTFDSSQKWDEFLFVPYMGACIHTPPPPPNQIILIRSDPATRVEDIWAPYWIEGTLSTEKTENDLGDTAYTMSMMSLEPYPTR